MKTIEGFSNYLLTEIDKVITKEGEIEVEIKNNKVTIKNDDGKEKTVSIGFLKEMSEPMEEASTEAPVEEANDDVATKDPKEDKKEYKDVTKGVKKGVTKKTAGKKTAKKEAATEKTVVKKATTKKATPKASTANTPVVKKALVSDKPVSLSQKIRDLYTDKKTERKEIHKILKCSGKYVTDVTWRHDNPVGKKK